MENRLTVAGFGGQGVMMIGQLLCYASVDNGREALFLPHYGPEQRGGTANCTVILSDSAIGSPISKEIQCLIAMNKPALEKFQDNVSQTGVIFINSDQISSDDVRKDVKCFAVPVDSIARELGSQKVANIVMLGAYVKYSRFFSKEEILNTVCAKLAKKPEFLEMNKLAIAKGMDRV